MVPTAYELLPDLARRARRVAVKTGTRVVIRGEWSPRCGCWHYLATLAL